MEIPSAQPTTILLVRHAQTQWNKEQRYAGSAEVPLAAEAAEQISELSEKLQDEPISAIYSSPLSRCQLTIGPTAKSLHLPITIKEELKERNLGEWEGKSPSELSLHHGGYHFPDSAYNGEFRIPHAEPLEELEDRVRTFLHTVANRHPGETIALATHAGIIWIIQKRIITNPPAHIAWPSNCSIYRLIAEGQHFSLN
jgi:broad specificity phosphatase PhoE